MQIFLLSAATSPALPGIFASLGPTLDHYGYLAVFGLIFLEDFGVPVPGETVLIAAAVYAGAGTLNPVLVGLCALAGAIVGDSVGYLIGRLLERRLLLRFGRVLHLTEARLARAEEFFLHHGGKIIIGARFVEGLRQANGIVAGLTEIPWLRFLFFNSIGAVLWVATWLTIGDTAGAHLTTIYHDVTRYSLLVVAIVALTGIGYLLLRYVHRNDPPRAESTHRRHKI